MKENQDPRSNEQIRSASQRVKDVLRQGSPRVNIKSRAVSVSKNAYSPGDSMEKL
jgi:hypothetical protein